MRACISLFYDYVEFDWFVVLVAPRAERRAAAPCEEANWRPRTMGVFIQRNPGRTATEALAPATRGVSGNRAVLFEAHAGQRQNVDTEQMVT